MLSLPRSKWTILQHHHTFPANSKPTILYSSSICKEHSGYYFKMLTANTKSIRYKFAYPDSTSSNFYLPPRYETPTLDVNISLNMANLQMINILAQGFHIWQHLGDNRSEAQLQHLTTIPSIPVHKIYQHLLNNTLPIMPFDMDKESTEHTDSTWTLFLHTTMYIIAIGLLIPAGLGLFLLLLLLVLTCQISALTFTNR